MAQLSEGAPGPGERDDASIPPGRLEVDPAQPDPGLPGPVQGGRRPRSRPARWVVIVLLAVLAYGAVLALYTRSGSNEGYASAAATPADGVEVMVELGELNAAANRQQADVTIVPEVDRLAADGISPNTDIDLVLVPTAGQQELHFPAGQIPATVTVQLLVDGEIENWPLDTYSGLLLVQASSPAGDGARKPIPFTVVIDGHVRGWKTAVTAVAAPGAVATDLQTFDYSAKRAGGTLAFGLVMVVILVALPVLALFATTEVFRGRRKVEPAFASWIAAMLFATVPLRNFLPGSPPPGSWIDVTVVLWVLVGLVVAMVLYVAAWWRRGRAL